MGRRRLSKTLLRWMLVLVLSILWLLQCSWRAARGSSRHCLARVLRRGPASAIDLDAIFGLHRPSHAGYLLGSPPGGPEGALEVSAGAATARKLFVALCLGLGAVAASYRGAAGGFWNHSIVWRQAFLVVVVSAVDGVMALQEIPRSVTISSCGSRRKRRRRRARGRRNVVRRGGILTAGRRTCGR